MVTSGDGQPEIWMILGAWKGECEKYQARGGNGEKHSRNVRVMEEMQQYAHWSVYGFSPIPYQLQCLQ